MSWNLIDTKFVACKDIDRVRGHIANAKTFDEFLKAMDDMVNSIMGMKSQLIKDGIKET